MRGICPKWFLWNGQSIWIKKVTMQQLMLVVVVYTEFINETLNLIMNTHIYTHIYTSED